MILEGKNMKKKSHIIFGVVSTLAIIGAGAGLIFHHNEEVQTAKKAMIKAERELISVKGDLLEAENQLSNDENGSESNFNVLFSRTNFTKKETVALPQNPNYHINSQNVRKWFLTYANEVRKLNGNSSPLNWSANSSEQKVADTLEQESTITLPGEVNYDMLSFSNIGETPASSMKIQSDQEFAYLAVMTLYDSGADFSGRAYLLYDGPNVGLSFTPDTMVVFDQKVSNSYNAMINATITPQTVALPDITFNYIDQKTLVADKAKIVSAKDNVTAAQTALKKAKKVLVKTQHSIF